MSATLQVSSPHSHADRMSFYNRLRQPVVLVTEERGREVYHDSTRLFQRLHSEPKILSIYQGNEFVSEVGVAALETMLQTAGLHPFFRVCRKRRGPERAVMTKYCWQYLSDFLGWEWHRHE